MKKTGVNPFLPSWEYIPDGEPHVFNDTDGNPRVYLYGSHDKFNGYAYCMNDYVCWSAPENDLTDWRYEGIIYRKTDDPQNKDGSMHLYAPDVTRGQDGKFYLYYVLDKLDVISVAVCSAPCGKYEFLGYVHYPCGTLLGRKEDDVPQFDPAVFTEGSKTYLYSGQCTGNGKTVEDYRNHSIAVVLGSDMLTIQEGPFPVIPGINASEGTGFEGHEFFEASSIRKKDDTWYFIYSAYSMNELCYATSKHPLKDFKYGGVIVSNADLNIDAYKPAKKQMYFSNNNHGSIAQIAGSWYIFYHRHTNGNEFSRQACLEPIKFNKDGSINQVEMTSSGPNGAPLPCFGEYGAYIACNIFSLDEIAPPLKTYWPNRNPEMPFITQDECDSYDTKKNYENGFITNIIDNRAVGFKYFDCKGVTKIAVKIRGYCRGFFEVRIKWDGEPLGKIDVVSSNIWKYFSSDISIPDGIRSLYFIYRGTGIGTLGSFKLS
ncbi:MAG: family 43 glycosylhydrolase [Treponema sp.]|nr:family 43 glycosylhydrolase [Treponema sp.]